MDNIFFTKLVPAGSRIYYFDCRTDKSEQPYLSITEVPCNGKDKLRHRIFVHQEDFAKFSQALSEALASMAEVTKR